MSEFDNDLDFTKISKEVSVALAKDEKYQRENDAKFRAINQKVKSYDEFRDIVEASHLKPLDKVDKLGGIAYQKWNQHASSGINSQENVSKPDVNVPVSDKQPANSFEFSKVWKRSCSTPQSKFDYLIFIKTENLKKCLEIDCMLGDVISMLHVCVDQVRCHFTTVLNILQVMSSTKRFSLDLDFLNSDELTKLQQLFELFVTLSSEQDEAVQHLVQSLLKKYKI